MKPSLPQFDTNASLRKDALTRNQQLYQFDYDYLQPFALLDGGKEGEKVPHLERFAGDYTTGRLLASTQIQSNLLTAKARSFFDPLDRLEDYDDLYTILPEPQVAKTYQTDRCFAEQRLSGANPMVLRGLHPADDRAKILEKLPSYHPSFEPLFNITNELNNGNIYIADYTGETDDYAGPRYVQGGTFERGRKYLPKPRAFFCWRSSGIGDRGELMPIAIQLNPNPDSRIYHPFDPYLDWLFAKLCVQVADANHHELHVHLARTHLVMEPFAIVTNRQLAENHPLSLLLRPHFRFMLANNNLAHSRLINPSGPVDHLMAGNLAESMEIVKASMRTWRLDEAALPIELAGRGMDDRTRLPHYPYRDDGLLLWQAINEYVAQYLRYFYPTVADIQDDDELQNWAAELVAADGGRVQGMPDQITSVDQLINIVTNVLFICGPQHSAINSPQYDYMSFAANMPLAAYRPAIAQAVTVTEAELLQFLPPYKQAADQLHVLFILAAYRYDRLGYYEKSFRDLYQMELADLFAGTPIPGFVEQFQQKLNWIEQEIDRANRGRVVPYPYFKPSLVLNSISI